MIRTQKIGHSCCILEIKMNKKSYIDILDIYYISNRDTFKQNMRIFKKGIILTTVYDDVINKKLAENLWIPPSLTKQNLNDYNVHENRFWYFKKPRLMYMMLIFVILVSVAVVMFWFILKMSPMIASSETYPVLNPDLCDTANPYYDSSWFTPTPDYNFNCNTPIEISEIFIQGLKNYPSQTGNCLSKLDCLSLIGTYFLERIHDSKYSFFIDRNSNVYSARAWLCPYASGQLWVGVMADTYNPYGDSDEMKDILKHFNSEVVSYAVKCNFLNFDRLKITYLNETHFYNVG